MHVQKQASVQCVYTISSLGPFLLASFYIMSLHTQRSASTLHAQKCTSQSYTLKTLFCIQNWKVWKGPKDEAIGYIQIHTVDSESPKTRNSTWESSILYLYELGGHQIQVIQVLDLQ